MRINQNIYALNAQRNLQVTNNRLAVSLERLSSGLRINRASDDAAGLAISEKLRAQVSGLGVSIDNANDGISLIRTAEGALDRVNAILKRMRDLVGWAANGDKTDADRQKYQDEINQLIAEINRISTTTEYNTKKLLNGNLGTKATIDTNAYSNIVENNAIGISGTVGGTGTYQVSVSTAGQANYTAIGLGTTVTLPVTTSLATVLDYTSGDAFTKSITVSQADGKSATVTLTITTGATGDTIETMLNKLNTAFTNAGMQVRAEFNSATNEIKLMSQEVGSKYDVTWIESNSISGAPTFTGAYQLSQVTFGNIFATTGLSAALNLSGAADTVTFGFTLANGTSIQYATFGHNWLTEVTFGTIGDTTTLSQALNLADSASAVTFSFTLVDNTVVQYATAGNVTIGAFVSALNNLFTSRGLGVTVIFEDAADKLVFTSATGSTKIIDYDVTAGAVTIGTAGTEIYDNVSINELVSALNTEFGKYTATYGLGVTVSFDDAADKLVFQYGAGSTKIIDYAVTAGAVAIGTAGTEVGTFASTDKVSVKSIDVTILVTDPVTNIGRTVTSTSREFAAGTGGPNVSVDSSGISGVTFKLTKDAASTTGTYFEFDLTKGSITLQIGPNAGSDHRMEITINDMGANALGVTNINVTNQASAQAIIDAQTIDKAIEKVVTERGKLGAYENRLNHTIQNLGVAKENLTSAESRLRDADLAQEMMEFTRNQIMLQAGTAMLAQANTVPQTVLQLLR
jgi:flagellin